MAEVRQVARKAEDLGYAALTIADHFDAQVGPLTALAAAAGVTTTLGLGTLVLANDYRHPVVLAKEIASLDQLSEGRITFGLGAGWDVGDYERAGLPMDRAGVRIARLEEALDLFDAALLRRRGAPRGRALPGARDRGRARCRCNSPGHGSCSAAAARACCASRRRAPMSSP